MLESEAKGAAESLDQARERRTFLAHLDEDFAGLTVFEEANCEVTLVAGDREFMCDLLPRGWKCLSARRSGDRHGSDGPRGEGAGRRAVGVESNRPRQRGYRLAQRWRSIFA